MVQSDRKVEAFRKNSWKSVRFMDLRPGDKFRLLEDGKFVVDKCGYTEFVAASFPYHVVTDEGIKTLAVNTESYENVRY